MTSEASSQNLDDNNDKEYVAVFETMAMVQCVVRVKAKDTAEALADAYNLAEKSNISQFKILNINTEDLVNTSVEEDYSSSISTTVEGSCRVDWMDAEENVLESSNILPYDEAMQIAKTILDPSKLTVAVAAKIVNVADESRLLVIKSPRGGFEISGRMAGDSELTYHSWNDTEKIAITRAAELKKQGLKDITVTNLTDRKNPKVILTWS